MKATCFYVTHFDCNRDELPILALAIKDFVGEYFPGLFVHVEFRALRRRKKGQVQVVYGFL